MQTILLTGATGFLGRNLLDRLSQSKECKLRAIVRKEVELDRNIEQMCGDLNDNKLLEKAVKGVDIVVHLAALRPGKPGYPEDCWRINYAATKALLDYSVKNEIEHFVFCSTVGVTGWQKKLPMDEATPYHPVGPYHESKTAAEKLALHYKETLPITIVRPTITYGPGDIDGFVAKTFQLVARGVFVFVGNGSNHVHLSYVRNIVEGFSCILSNGGSGETYILADDDAIVMRDLVEHVSTFLHASYNRVFLPYTFAKAAMRLYEGTSKGSLSARLPKATTESIDVLSKNRYYSIARARKLGYKPEVSTVEGLRVSTPWYNELVGLKTRMNIIPNSHHKPTGEVEHANVDTMTHSRWV